MYGRATPSGPWTGGWFDTRCTIARYPRTISGPGKTRQSGGLAVALAEPVNASGCIHQALLSGEERMASGAHIDGKILGTCRPRLKLVAARAGDVDDLVLGVNSFFHCALQIPGGPESGLRRHRVIGDCPGQRGAQASASGTHIQGSPTDRVENAVQQVATASPGRYVPGHPCRGLCPVL